MIIYWNWQCYLVHKDRVFLVLVNVAKDWHSYKGSQLYRFTKLIYVRSCFDELMHASEEQWTKDRFQHTLKLEAWTQPLEIIVQVIGAKTHCKTAEWSAWLRPVFLFFVKACTLRYAEMD